MDVCESNIALQKHTSVEKLRPPLVPAERNNAVTSTHRPRTREVPSRYKSPSPSTPSAPSPRRCSSPNLSRTATTPTPSLVAPKRALSAERKRPSTPTSPQRPSTPVQDSSVDMHMTSRKVVTGRLAESLWPSTMRSLSVSFQSDIISIPVAKKEKPVSNTSIDRTLRPSSNAAVRQAETPTAARKTTPERRRSPLKGKNVSDQSENSKPVDGLSSRLIDQHRWPSRAGGKVSISNAVNSSTDLGDKIIRNPTTMAGVGLASVRRVPSSDGPAKRLQKSSSDAAKLSVNGIHREDCEGNSFEDNWAGFFGQNKVVSSIVADRGTALTPAVRSRSLPASRQPSPGRTLSSSLSRGVSPSSSRPSTPPSRGVSPSRIRASATSTQSTTTPSVLSFIVDFRKGKKSSVYIEDAHQLRLLHNRYLQWRFANARAEAALHNQKVKTEETMYNVWKITLILVESVIRKRILLQQMRLELKLNSVLNGQMAYLDEWASLERDHIISLAGAVEDLEASTLRLPVTGGARADIETLKVALRSSLDVMQATGSSVRWLFSRVEKMNELVTELALVAAHERAMLGECEALLGSAAAMQIEEHSLRIHITQLKQALEDGRTQFWQLNTTKDSTLLL